MFIGSAAEIASEYKRVAELAEIVIARGNTGIGIFAAFTAILEVGRKPSGPPTAGKVIASLPSLKVTLPEALMDHLQSLKDGDRSKLPSEDSHAAPKRRRLNKGAHPEVECDADPTRAKVKLEHIEAAALPSAASAASAVPSSGADAAASSGEPQADELNDLFAATFAAEAEEGEEDLLY